MTTIDLVTILARNPETEAEQLIHNTAEEALSLLETEGESVYSWLVEGDFFAPENRAAWVGWLESDWIG
jgi:hypothetical protein